MNTTKIDSNSIKVTHEQVVFRADLLSEKETLEARILVLNEMLGVLDK
jgi:hypothetical protein